MLESFPSEIYQVRLRTLANQLRELKTDDIEPWEEHKQRMMRMVELLTQAGELLLRIAAESIRKGRQLPETIREQLLAASGSRPAPGLSGGITFVMGHPVNVWRAFAGGMLSRIKPAADGKALLMDARDGVAPIVHPGLFPQLKMEDVVNNTPAYLNSIIERDAVCCELLAHELSSFVEVKAGGDWDPKGKRKPGRPPREAGKNWLLKALQLRNKHPDWSDARIADEVGCSASTLSRDPTYQSAKNLARSNLEQLSGYITTDDSGQCDLEAIDDGGDEACARQLASSRRRKTGKQG